MNVEKMMQMSPLEIAMRLNIFQDSITSIINEIEENLRFRNDLEMTVNYGKEGNGGNLFSVKSNIDDMCLDFSYDMQIDDSEGAESSLDFSCGDKEFSVSILYCNGAVEYDDESGLYMPITEDEIGDIGDAVNGIMDLINSELTNYMEICESEDIAESVLCYECGEESICINEDLLPVVTCMNCGYVNLVYECDRCQLWFNSDEEGRVFDDNAFCQNCLDEYEEE